MSTIPSPVFTGVSSYASDLQQVITRAVNIAALPLSQLNNQLQDLNHRATDLSSIDGVFAKLRTAVQNLNQSLGAKSFSGVSSIPDAVGVSVGTGALASSYTLDITSIGSYSNSISNPALPAVSDPSSTSISDSTTYTLTVNGTAHEITSESGGLNGLAQAINGASAGVHASLVNFGTTAAPQYRLMLRSDTLGPDSIQLNDGTQDLLDPLNDGTLAEYTVNGASGTIQSTSRNVTLAPGITANLLKTTTTGEPATITVSRDTAAASESLSALAEAYNAAVAALDKQVGPDAGLLSGDAVIRDLRGTLRQLVQYQSPSGSLSSLSQLGLTLDQSGLLTFDSVKFNAAGVDAVQSFLGSAAGGFVKAATDIVDAIEDPITGSVKKAISSLDEQIKDQNSLITENEQRVLNFQTNLEQQMAAADARIATLESQKNYITNLFIAMMNNQNSLKGN